MSSPLVFHTSSVFISMINSLAPRRCGSNFTWIFLNLIFKMISWALHKKLILGECHKIPLLVQVVVWCRQATNHYLSQYWPRSISPYGITRPQYVNSLWPSDAICWHRSGSTLAQVMACGLMAPSHSLNQCWLKLAWKLLILDFIQTFQGPMS